MVGLEVDSHIHSQEQREEAHMHAHARLAFLSPIQSKILSLEYGVAHSGQIFPHQSIAKIISLRHSHRPIPRHSSQAISDCVNVAMKTNYHKECARICADFHIDFQAHILISFLEQNHLCPKKDHKS